MIGLSGPFLHLLKYLEICPMQETIQLVIPLYLIRKKAIMAFCCF